jgi:hypothetical protein
MKSNMDTLGHTNEQEEKHPSWKVTIDRSGNIEGLPEGISNKDVIVFKGNDDQWYAQNPSPELLQEIRLWRTDWNDV